MDSQLKEYMHRVTPKINPDIANGVAVKYLAKVEEYVDSVMRSAAKDFPTGLDYVGCERCTPLEEAKYVTSVKSNKRTFDIARSDIYLMKYHFKFKGVDLPPRYLYLPFVSDAGTMYLGGPRFVISPVLLDKVISIGMTKVFVRLLRDKLTFERLPHDIKVNGHRETVQVVTSLIYHVPTGPNKPKPTLNAHCALMHYLLCKYGFSEAFKRFGNCVPVVGTTNITKERYPEEDWVIVASNQMKPKGLGKMVYTPSEVRLAIRKEDFTPMVKAMVGGFFYVVDHFPQRLPPEWLEASRQWMVLMGHILFSGSIGEGRLHDDVAEHFKSLDEYIDRIGATKLKDIGYGCDNVYQLFGIVIDKFNEWILLANEKVSSMYDKELDVLYSVLYGISSAIFKLHFKLKTTAKRELTEKDIINTMKTVLTPGLIYAIRNKCNSVSTVSYSGDNKFFKITCMLVPQQKNSSNKQPTKERESLSDPSKRLHVSIAEVGGYLNLPKHEPSGRNRINPHIQIDQKGTVLRDPKKLALLTSVQDIIRRN